MEYKQQEINLSPYTIYMKQNHKVITIILNTNFISSIVKANKSNVQVHQFTLLQIIAWLIK